MTRTLLLEDFDNAPGAPRPPVAGPAGAPDPADTGEAALAAFEEGYRNGWEDCTRAEAEGHRRIAADLAANLHELSQGYETARSEVLDSLGPVFEQMAAQLLPALAAEAVAPAVLAELRAAAEEASAARAVLLAAPAALPALERLVETQEGLSVDLRAEPAFAEGQVSLRFDGERRDIDLGQAARRMAETLRSFLAEQTGRPPGADSTRGAA